MFTDIIRKQTDDGVPAKALASALGVGTTTIYRYLNGESEPCYTALRTMSRDRMLPTACRAAVLSDLAGPDFRVTPEDATNLDFNGDGREDIADLADASLAILKDSARLEALVSMALRNDELDRDEAAEVMQAADELQTVAQALKAIAEARMTRRISLRKVSA